MAANISWFTCLQSILYWWFVFNNKAEAVPNIPSVEPELSVPQPQEVIYQDNPELVQQLDEGNFLFQNQKNDTK